MKKFLIIISILQLTACADGWQNPMPRTTNDVSEDFSDSTKSFRATVADAIFPEVNHEQVVNSPPVVVVHPFCYRTWDKPVCYTRPQLGKEAELVGGGPL